jgi:hypothetical protein
MERTHVKTYKVTHIQGNLNMGGKEYWENNTIFLFETTARGLGFPEIKLGDSIKLYSNDRGEYIKGEIIS